MQQPLDLCQELPVFFNQWRVYSRFTPLEDKVPAFFEELRAVLPASRVRDPEKKKLGQFLALTGARMDGAECRWAGLATHYLPHDALAEAKARLAQGHDPAQALSALALTPPPARIEGNAVQIARHFASDRYEDILASLTADDSDWAAKELATLRTKSPQTCKVALRQLADSLKCGSFAENMAMEYRVASRVLTLPDFAEGVRAVIVDKDNTPQWNPATPEGVTDQLIDSIFAALPANEEWKPL